MGESRFLSHSGGIGGWSMVAENVGTGGNPDVVFSALTSSSTHYSTMTDASYAQAGIAVWVDPYGQLWTVHVFVSA